MKLYHTNYYQNASEPIDIWQNQTEPSGRFPAADFEKCEFIVESNLIGGAPEHAVLTGWHANFDNNIPTSGIALLNMESTGWDLPNKRRILIAAMKEYRPDVRLVPYPYPKAPFGWDLSGTGANQALQFISLNSYQWDSFDTSGSGTIYAAGPEIYEAGWKPTWWGIYGTTGYNKESSEWNSGRLDWTMDQAVTMIDSGSWSSGNIHICPVIRQGPVSEHARNGGYIHSGLFSSILGVTKHRTNEMMIWGGWFSFGNSGDGIEGFFNSLGPFVKPQGNYGDPVYWYSPQSIDFPTIMESMGCKCYNGDYYWGPEPVITGALGGAIKIDSEKMRQALFQRGTTPNLTYSGQNIMDTGLMRDAFGFGVTSSYTSAWELGWEPTMSGRMQMIIDTSGSYFDYDPTA